MGKQRSKNKVWKRTVENVVPLLAFHNNPVSLTMSLFDGKFEKSNKMDNKMDVDSLPEETLMDLARQSMLEQGSPEDFVNQMLADQGVEYAKDILRSSPNINIGGNRDLGLFKSFEGPDIKSPKGYSTREKALSGSMGYLGYKTGQAALATGTTMRKSAEMANRLIQGGMTAKEVDALYQNVFKLPVHSQKKVWKAMSHFGSNITPGSKWNFADGLSSFDSRTLFGGSGSEVPLKAMEAYYGKDNVIIDPKTGETRIYDNGKQVFKGATTKDGVVRVKSNVGKKRIRPFTKADQALDQIRHIYGATTSGAKKGYGNVRDFVKGYEDTNTEKVFKSTKEAPSAKKAKVTPATTLGKQNQQVNLPGPLQKASTKGGWGLPKNQQSALPETVAKESPKVGFKKRWSAATKVLIGKGGGNLGIVAEPFNRGHNKYTTKTVAKPKSNLRSIGGTVGSVAGAVTMAPYISDEIQNVRKGKGLGAVAYDNVTGLPLLPLILAEAGEKLVKGRLPWKDSWSQEPTSIGPVIEKTHEFMEGGKDYVLMDKSVRERKRDVRRLESESDWGQGVIYEAPKKNMLGMYYDDKNLFGKRKEVKSNAPIYSSMKKEIHDAITKPNKASGQKALSDLVHAYNLEHGLYDTKDEMTTKKAMDIGRKVYTKKYKKK